MKKIIVELCMGTTCFVMGGSGLEEFVELLNPQELELVEVRHSSCIGLCKDRKYGKAPYALVAGEPLAEATAVSLANKIKELLK